MRSFALISALFAAGALSSPIQKRDYVTDIDTVWVTDTVTAAEVTSTTSVSVASTTVEPVVTTTTWTYQENWRHPQFSSAFSSSAAVSSASSTSEVSVAAVTSTSVYVAPSSSSTSVSSADPTTAKPSSTSQAATSAASSASGPSGTDYASLVTYHHNVHRANHTAPDLTYNTTLASIAADIASSCVYAHNTAQGGGGYGQNIAASSDNSPTSIGATISNGFYGNEVDWYSTPTNLFGLASPSMANFEKWGHFSQIVWKGTESVGCATQSCPNGLVNESGMKYFTVCNYYPPGNFGGEYAENVGESLHKAPVYG